MDVCDEMGLFSQANVYASVYWDEYESCRNDLDYGNTTLVCDPSHRLANTTTAKLTDMLWKLQSRVGCECVDGCRRDNGRDEFIGLLHVTSSKNLTKGLILTVKSELQP
ncbi:hypothetical protein OESDEN_05889 [Oesophagostomum dentatum]|uniref:Uncharacterized protein n=1 Tax=Oesophagostomum dentatum TaxID=61180 RepID=A0A0B1TEG2_OESDE|nr:hypothetical protein OESDEN_05889 [Oesophagostomum dentatum]